VQVYAQWFGMYVLATLIVAVVFSTLVVPRSKGMRSVVGFLAAGWLGLVANLVDRDGTVGPRVTAVVVAFVAGAVHGYVLYVLFLDPELAPDPAVGVWVGLGGLAAVAIGGIIGTRVERMPA
jgi:hypothetical protein